MARFFSLYLIALFFSFSAFAQTTKSFSLAEFEGVSVNYGIDAEIVKGNEHKIEVTADQKLIDALQMPIENGVLKLTYDQKDWSRLSRLLRKNSIKIVVTTPELNTLMANGGADVFSRVVWTAKEFKANCNGGADLHVKVDCDMLRATANGGADVYLSGNAEKCKIVANGGADVEGEDLIVAYADVNANGAADVSIHASKELKARANGAADIEYFGSASKIDVRANGGADIDRG